MTETRTTPRLEDVASVGSRISWSAIFAGAMLALAIYFLLMVLGTAVGLSYANRLDASNENFNGLVGWALITLCVSVFVGGVISSQFTVGENKVEAVIGGILSWAVMLAMLTFLGGVGVRAGYHAMNITRADSSAVETRSATSPNRVSDPEIQEAKILGWYAFAAAWLSMMAGAVGGWVGAGPTFRAVVVNRPLNM